VLLVSATLLANVAASFDADNQIQYLKQINGYDPAGNVTYDGKNQYLYDAEGRICAVASIPVPGVTVMTGYIYGADGTRVAKGRISIWSCDPSTSGFTATNDYILGLSSEQVTELGTDPDSGGMEWQHTNVYAAGKLIATYDPDGVHFHLDDPLGTRRVQTDLAGAVEQTYASLPFGDCPDGDTLSCTGGATEHHFTGKERDSESGNDYFGARYYASSMGRMLSPDPVFASAARVMDPQQWNMYAYARNNPLSITDPTGMDFNLKCNDGETMNCSGGYQGQYQYNSGSGQFEFEKTDVDMNKQGDPSAGYSDQFGNNYTGTFDQNNGVSFTNTATGATSGQSQFVDGSDPTQLKGSGAFSGIQGNFFDACGGNSSCQGRATLSGSAAAFDNMKSTLSQSGRFSTLLDGFSLAHPFVTDQYRGGVGGYAHVIKAPGYMWDMHFEGSSPGAGVTGFALHMLGTIKEMVDGTAIGERSKLVPEQ